MPSKNEPVYFCALPNHEDLDNESEGQAFAKKITEFFSQKPPIDKLVIDLSGAYTDYYGCSPISDACIEILKKATTDGLRQLNIITSFRNELSAQYAMLFFYKSTLQAEQLAPDDYEAISGAARTICKSNNLEFNVYVVPANFEYSNFAALGNPDFVLSSK